MTATETAIEGCRGIHPILGKTHFLRRTQGHRQQLTKGSARPDKLPYLRILEQVASEHLHRCVQRFEGPFQRTTGLHVRPRKRTDHGTLSLRSRTSAAEKGDGGDLLNPIERTNCADYYTVKTLLAKIPQAAHPHSSSLQTRWLVSTDQRVQAGAGMIFGAST